MKKTISVLLAAAILLSTAVFLNSCSCKKDTEFPVTVAGVTIEKAPENIVILNKNLADIVCAMSYDGKMVAKSDEVNQEEFEDVPSVGSAKNPSVSKISDKKADLVLADSSLENSVKSKLKNKGIKVVILENANTLKQMQGLYIKIGTMLGGKDTGKAKAEKAYNQIHDTLRDIKRAAKHDNTITTIAYLYIDNGALKTVAKGTWGAALIDFTGSMNIFKNASSDVIDPETLRRANPDNIFISDESVRDYLLASETLSDLSALSEHTFVLPYDDLTLQGLNSLETIRKMIDGISGELNKDDNSDLENSGSDNEEDSDGEADE